MSFFILFHTRGQPNTFQGPFDNQGLVTVQYQCFGNKTRLQPWGMACQSHAVSYNNQSARQIRDMITDNLLVNEWVLERQMNAPAWSSVEWFAHLINQFPFPIRWGRWNNQLTRFGANDSEIYVYAYGRMGTYVHALPWRFGALNGNAQKSDTVLLTMNGVVSGVNIPIPVTVGESGAVVTQRIFNAMQQAGISDVTLANGVIQWRKMPYPVAEDCIRVEFTDSVCGLEFSMACATDADPNFPTGDHG